MKRVPLSEVKDDLSRYVRLAAHEEIVLTRHGRPAAVLIGFEYENDWFDYQLEHNPRFIVRMGAARRSLEAGRGISIEEVRKRLGLRTEPGRRTERPSKRARVPRRANVKKRSR